MKHYTFKLRTQDGLQLFAQVWEPGGKVRAVVYLLHGLGEHSGRFAHLARFLTPTGYAVVSFDLRGHGNSEGIRGHFASLDLVMHDIDGLIAAARERYSDVPAFLYGHSLGGVLALSYILRREPELAGVIVTSPGLKTALQDQKAKIALARFLGIFAPALTLPSGLELQALSRDPQVVAAYIRDPLVHDRASLAFANGMLREIQWIDAHAGEFHLPLLVMHGAADRLAYYQGSQAFARQVQGDCTLKLWDGLYHELHNEPEKGEVFTYLLLWLEAHLDHPAPVDDR